MKLIETVLLSVQAHRQEILVTTYEARANPADHKTTDLLDSVRHEIQ